MNPYSKINGIGKNKSRSMEDFSDLNTCLEPEPTKTNLPTNTTEASFTLQEAANKIKNDNVSSNNANQDSPSVPEDQTDQESSVEHVQRFDTATHVVLKRNSSVSAAASASALQSAVKRAFSMRRSSSVTERYSRIHDQSAALTSPNHDEDGFIVTMDRTRSVKKKSSRGRIFRACKKLFGL